MYKFKRNLLNENLIWQATEELMCMMKMMAERKPDHSAEEAAAVENFRKTILSVCTAGLDPRVMWQTLLLWVDILDISTFQPSNLIVGL